MWIVTVTCALAGTRVSAQTEVGGVIDVDTKWEGGPYLVVSDLLIAADAHLVISPGTKILISNPKHPSLATPQFDKLDSTSISIKVKGSFTCIGRRDNPITISSVDTSRHGLKWYGIIFDTANGRFCEIAFTTISNAYFGVTASACAPLIRNSRIERNNIGIFCSFKGNALVYNCLFHDNYTAGIRVENANPHIANNIFLRNRGNGLWCDGLSRVTFEHNCLFENGDGPFLDCDPELGRIIQLNSRKDSVDKENNLYRDPVFAGSPADSEAFALDLSRTTDTSAVKNQSLLSLFRKKKNTPLESTYEEYRKKFQTPFSLSRYSPCIDAGLSASSFIDKDETPNDIGPSGGPDFFDRGKR